MEVTNAGGAAGFPFPPVDGAEVAPVLDALLAGLDAGTGRLVTAHLDGRLDGRLAGWLDLRRDPWALISHWGTLHHVQTRTAVRGRGVGAAPVNEARRIARVEILMLLSPL
ncbi:hypothetical protein GCM10010182_50790 [Actinomadura cremea]|nr:hypothetical protein GCM10010182_50790 [Actinomadura cremea]